MTYEEFEKLRNYLRDNPLRNRPPIIQFDLCQIGKSTSAHHTLDRLKDMKEELERLRLECSAHIQAREEAEAQVYELTQALAARAGSPGVQR